MSIDWLKNPEISQNIDLFSAWAESQMAYKGQPGLSIAILHDQELIWTKGFGFANLKEKVKAAPDTIYRIASITKLFTATAIMILRDDGKLQLDDPVEKHLPWFKIQNTFPDAPTITILHLLTHTSGLPREANFPYWETNDFPTTKMIKEALPEQKTIFPTVKEWKYSNLAVSLAGEIVAAVSGKSYSDFIQERVLNPLEMTSTYVTNLTPDNPRLAVGYGRRTPDGKRADGVFTDCKGITPAANIATTVEDLARFAMLQMRSGPAGGAQILSGNTLEEMHRVHWLDPDWKAGWGIGFRVERREDKTIFGHGGSLQGYRTQLAINPEEKLAVIVMTNADDGNPDLYVEKALKWVFPALAKVAAPAKKPVSAEKKYKAFCGRYRNLWGDSQVMVYNGELVMIDPAETDPIPDMVHLDPVGDNKFRMTSKNGYSSNGEMAEFELDEKGHVTRLITGMSYSFPVKKW